MNADQTLDKPYKGRFPFRIGTTSFIYRDDYVPNVCRLGPYLDEIELLFFDSAYDGALPTRDTVAKLAAVGRDADLTYNVHLPTDVFLGHEDPSVCQKAVDTLVRVIDLAAPLAPTTLTLHLLPVPNSGADDHLAAWRDRLRLGLNGVLTGSGIDSRRISVETLDYPFEWVEAVVSDLNLSVCLDLGHLLVYGYDIPPLVHRFASRTPIVHLHGVENGKDHLSLDRMDGNDLAEILDILRGFSGTVSVEVFSFSDLQTSLRVLETAWTD